MSKCFITILLWSRTCPNILRITWGSGWRFSGNCFAWTQSWRTWSITRQHQLVCWRLTMGRVELFWWREWNRKSVTTLACMPQNTPQISLLIWQGSLKTFGKCWLTWKLSMPNTMWWVYFKLQLFFHRVSFLRSFFKSLRLSLGLFETLNYGDNSNGRFFQLALFQKLILFGWLLRKTRIARPQYHNFFDE